MIRIDKIDKNLAVSTTITEPDLVWLDAKELPFVLQGVMYDENCRQYVRLPDSVAQTVAGVAHHVPDSTVQCQMAACQVTFVVII